MRTSLLPPACIPRCVRPQNLRRPPRLSLHFTEINSSFKFILARRFIGSRRSLGTQRPRCATLIKPLPSVHRERGVAHDERIVSRATYWFSHLRLLVRAFNVPSRAPAHRSDCSCQLVFGQRLCAVDADTGSCWRGHRGRRDVASLSERSAFKQQLSMYRYKELETNCRVRTPRSRSRSEYAS